MTDDARMRERAKELHDQLQSERHRRKVHDAGIPMPDCHAFQDLLAALRAEGERAYRRGAEEMRAAIYESLASGEGT